MTQRVLRRGDLGYQALRPGSASGLWLVALIAIGAAGYLYLVRHLGIASDEWSWLLYRIHPTAAVLYPNPHQSLLFAATLPYNSQPIVGEVLLYRVWADVFGVGHHWVLQVLYFAAHAGVVALAYFLVRRRVGGLPALLVAALVLVSGRAWQTVVFPASLTFMVPTLAACLAWNSIDCGVGRLCRTLVAVMLGLAALSGAATVAVMAGLVVELALRGQLRRAWIVVPGLALFVIWYVHEHAYLHSPPAAGVGTALLWAAKFLAAAAGAAVGVGPIPGALVLVGSVVMIAAWRRRSRVSWPRSPRFAGLLMTLLVIAILTAVSRADTATPPSSSRYMYLPAILLLLLACEALIGVVPAPRRRLLPVGLAAVALAWGLGIPDLRDGRNFYLTLGQASAALMGAMRAAHRPPKEIQPPDLVYTQALLSAFVSAYGSAPLDSQPELVTAPAAARQAVDQMLFTAEVSQAQDAAPGHCRRRSAGRLPRGRLTLSISARHGGRLLLSRYSAPSQGQPIRVGPSAIRLNIHPDSLTQRWRLLPTAGGPVVRICRAA